MIDLNNAIEFQFELDKKSLKELGRIPAVRAGIINDQKLWSWKKETRSLGGGITANKIKQGVHWRGETVGSSMASVFENTSIRKEFEELLNKKGPILLSRVIVSAPEGAKSNEAIRAANSFAALLKQAYMKMSKKRRNSKERALQKGFNAYAIGTGQTLMAIEAQLFEVRK